MSDRKSRGMVAAVMLGTALSALGAGEVTAAENVSGRAIRDISRYCTSCWRNARLPEHTWNDCTQEVYTRLLGSLPGERWDLALSAEGDERREFLRAIDAVKKRVQRSRKYADGVELAGDDRPRREASFREDREEVERAAAELLSDRQRRILRMSFEGCTTHEIGREMGMSVERVSDDKYKAVCKLRRHLAGREG